MDNNQDGHEPSGQDKGSIRLLREDIDLDTKERTLVLSIDTSIGQEEIRVRREELADRNRLNRTLMKYGKLGDGISESERIKLRDSLAHPKRRVTLRSGWFGEALVTRYGTYNAERNPEYAFNEEGNTWSPATQKGSKREFLQRIEPFLTTCPEILFAYILALVPPLASRIGGRLGFSVCYSQESSSGKTLCIRLAQSLSTQADMDDKLVSFGDTAKGIAVEAPSFACQLTGFNDVKAGSETGKELAEKLRFIAFGAVNGKTRRGVGSPKSVMSNFNLWFVSAEKTLAKIFEEGGLQIDKGDYPRLIDIQIPHGTLEGGILKGFNEAERPAKLAELESILTQHWGTVMPVWCKLGLHNAETKQTEQTGARLAAYVSKKEQLFLKMLGADRKLATHELRVAKHFALIYATGCVAINVKLVPISYHQLFNHTAYMFDRFYSTVHSEEAPTFTLTRPSPELIIERLQAFFDEAKQLPMAVMGQTFTGDATRGFRRLEGNRTHLYLRLEAIEEALKPVSTSMVRDTLKRLAAEKVIRPSKSNLTRHVLQAGMLKKERFIDVDLCELMKFSRSSEEQELVK